MARARNIKPGFFRNEDLAECSPWARLCFAGLWTLADREGRLQDRPKRIKGELFPFDAFEVGPLLDELAAHGFILRYVVQGAAFIQILAFARHQNPHHKEPPSVIPAPPDWGPGPGDDGGADGVADGADGAGTIAATNTPEDAPEECADGSTPPKTASFCGMGGKSRVLTPCHEPKSETGGPWKGGQTRLIPDSGFLIPDSPQPLTAGEPTTHPPNPPKGGQRGSVGLKAWLVLQKAAGVKAVPEGDPVFAYAQRVGIPAEFLDLAWQAFKRRYVEQYPDKRYRDWRRVFRNAVEGNWLRLWYVHPQSGYALTTVGVQARRMAQEAA